MDIKTFEILEKYCEKEGLKMAVPIQTNEEWFGTLSTEEKAKVISKLDCYHGNVYEIEQWLKNIHESEEK